jgi:hypothetical protein
MLSRLRAHLKFANVVSVLALFLALGGGAYAAATLPKNSVGPRQIKRNAVTPSKIKRGAITADKLSSSVLTGLKGGVAGATGETGTTGPQGPKGDPGEPGSAVAFGEFDGGQTGVTIGTRAKNLTQANISRPAPGVYCFSGLSFTPQNIQATLDARFTTIFVNATLVPVGPCPDGTQAVVKAFEPSGAPRDVSFSVAFN